MIRIEITDPSGFREAWKDPELATRHAQGWTVVCWWSTVEKAENGATQRTWVNLVIAPPMPDQGSDLRRLLLSMAEHGESQAKHQIRLAAVIGSIGAALLVWELARWLT